jgi:PHD/YefM family antitoxin component YafN of YafNO toxin-antitoxin module
MSEPMLDLREITSVTDFQKNIKSYAQKLAGTSVPMILTVNGKAELVVQNVETYQSLLQEVEKARFVAAVNQGIKEMEAGLGTDAKAVLRQLRDQLAL